jgi:hypothetical protein
LQLEVLWLEGGRGFKAGFFKLLLDFRYSPSGFKKNVAIYKITFPNRFFRFDIFSRLILTTAVTNIKTDGTVPLRNAVTV